MRNTATVDRWALSLRSPSIRRSSFRHLLARINGVRERSEVDSQRAPRGSSHSTPGTQCAAQSSRLCVSGIARIEPTHAQRDAIRSMPATALVLGRYCDRCRDTCVRWVACDMSRRSASFARRLALTLAGAIGAVTLALPAGLRVLLGGMPGARLVCGRAYSEVSLE
ncbi:hypothetical protein BC1002_7107 (plasmid) [Paraburkholderia atlantica]|uniref:Uncharacterized protein n=1 Tax=Paraburkholderia atlantica TaxID=2654982 RepID=D5WNH8_PARAM|nr:hypothetical protein BC1002_7107 [Paraburkholderia atlantica]